MFVPEVVSVPASGECVVIAAKFHLVDRKVFTIFHTFFLVFSCKSLHSPGAYLFSFPVDFCGFTVIGATCMELGQNNLLSRIKN